MLGTCSSLWTIFLPHYPQVFIFKYLKPRNAEVVQRFHCQPCKLLTLVPFPEHSHDPLNITEYRPRVPKHCWVALLITYIAGRTWALPHPSHALNWAPLSTALEGDTLPLGINKYQSRNLESCKYDRWNLTELCGRVQRIFGSVLLTDLQFCHWTFCSVTLRLFQWQLWGTTLWLLTISMVDFHNKIQQMQPSESYIPGGLKCFFLFLSLPLELATAVQVNQD